MKHATRYSGLKSAEVALRREQFGTNVLTPPKREPWWKLWLEKFDDPVVRILLIAAAIALAVGALHGEYVEGLGIIIAVLLATTLAFVNEYKAKREFDLISRVDDDIPVKIIRDGEFTAVARRELVVGDVVLVEAGEEVPADGELLESVTLVVNEASLTGESAPNVKVARDDASKSSLPAVAYSADTVLRGTLVVDGHGIFEVTGVGNSTEIGKTASAAAEETDTPTPLRRQLERLSKVIGAVGFLVAAATFAALVARGTVIGDLSLTLPQWAVAGIVAVGAMIGLLPVWLPMVRDGIDVFARARRAIKGSRTSEKTVPRWAVSLGSGTAIIVVGLSVAWLSGILPPTIEHWMPADAAQDFLLYFMIAVTIIVVAVPEGLAMSVTLSLAYNMRRMAAANALVRKMDACETIGAATVICSDKTGTLTMNEMRVQHVQFPALDGDLRLSHRNSPVQLIIEAISCNSTAHLNRNDESKTRTLGNPTEAALLLWLEEQGVDYSKHREAFRIDQQLTFSTERKFMATFGSSEDNKSVMHVKGAPEVVLSRCTSMLVGNTLNIVESIEGHREEIDRLLCQYQRRGMRTLGLAYRNDVSLAEDTSFENEAKGLTWLGFVAIADPIRPEVPLAIEACHEAGIRVTIVTGDNPDTAQEIARQIGLWHDDDTAKHLSGIEFQNLNGDIRQVASQLKILSRAKPLDKVRLVRTLQSDGDVVAVTGDGINDCGALNYADVGLSMGRTGKAAAKEASDIVLLDDSFSTIVNAVMWGRSLYENIQRFLVFQLTINVAALGIALLGPFLGVELPLTVTQMLWVNLIMDTFAALALATEPPHRDVLRRPPRRPEDFIVTPRMATAIFSVAAIFLVVMITGLRYIQQDGTIHPRELTQLFTGFVMLQFWNLFNARRFGVSRSALSGLWDSKSFLLIAAAIFCGQFLIVQFGGRLFRTVPLSLTDWLVIVATTSVVLWVGESWRWITRRHGQQEGAK